MIPQNEIRQLAREYGVPVSTIERDYVQNCLLMALSSPILILKGGTGIKKVYIGDYRFSDDLDFTLLEVITKEELEILIKDSVKRVREESGINFLEDIRFQENDNGFEADAYYQLMQRGENRTKIKIDITKPEEEKVLLPVVKKKIIHPYSDEVEAMVKAYALEEIMAEKIRSLFQRTRPRDLYDVWYLWDKIDANKVFKILPEKFRMKNVVVNIKDFEGRKDDFKNAWENSLKHQLKKLPDFDKVFLTVLQDAGKCLLR